jgi:hypothetical protein
MDGLGCVLTNVMFYPIETIVGKYDRVINTKAWFDNFSVRYNPMRVSLAVVPTIENGGLFALTISI